MERRQNRATTELRAEDVDKNGHWVREFTVRGIAWTTIEHWAGENRFRLVAMRGGRRRLYRLGDQPSDLVTFLECRLVERRLKLTAWVEAGWWGRARNFFRIPTVLLLSPAGSGALGYRRKVCRIFNELLVRLGQPPMVGSAGFHWVDTDTSTFLVGGVAALSILGYLQLTVWQWGVDRSLFWYVLPSFGKSFLFLLGAGLLAVLYQQFVIGGRLISSAMKFLSVGVVFVLLSGLSYYLAATTSVNLAQVRVSQFCLSKTADPAACARTLKGLSQADRTHMIQRVNFIGQALARRAGQSQQTE